MINGHSRWCIRIEKEDEYIKAVTKLYVDFFGILVTIVNIIAGG